MQEMENNEGGTDKLPSIIFMTQAQLDSLKTEVSPEDEAVNINSIPIRIIPDHSSEGKILFMSNPSKSWLNDVLGVSVFNQYGKSPLEPLGSTLNSIRMAEYYRKIKSAFMRSDIGWYRSPGVIGPTVKRRISRKLKKKLKGGAKASRMNRMLKRLSKSKTIHYGLDFGWGPSITVTDLFPVKTSCIIKMDFSNVNQTDI